MQTISRICFTFVFHILSDLHFVGTILFMDIECQHFTYFQLDPQYCILGMYREKLQDQVIVNHLILLFKCHIYFKKGDKIAPNLTGLKGNLGQKKV